MSAPCEAPVAPRCALLLYGLPKYFRARSYPSLVAHVIERMRMPVDVFVHTYDLRTTSNPRNCEDRCALDPDEVFDARPLAWEVESQARVDNDTEQLFTSLKTYGDAWANDFISLRNVLRQYNSINRVHALMDAHVRATGAGPYTTVIASRMDMLYIDDLEVALASTTAADAEARLYVPDFHAWGGLNDRFAIGGARAMRSYCVDRLGWAVRFCEARRRSMHSESFIAWRLAQDAAVQVRTMRFRMRRIRANGYVHDAELLAL